MTHVRPGYSLPEPQKSITSHLPNKQDKDRIGVGYTWSEPADRRLGHRGAIDAYYRVQLTPEIQISPKLEVIFDLVRNPDEDRIYVWGFRTRIEM